MESANKQLIQFQIKRIKDVSFFINEGLYIPDPKKVIKIDLNQSFGTNFEKKLVNLTLLIQLKYENAPPNEKLASMEVQNIFEIPELLSFVKDEEIELPFDLLVTLVSISLSHGRALLAKNMAGSIYQDTLMPILSPVDITQHFFKVPPNATTVGFKAGESGQLILLPKEEGKS